MRGLLLELHEKRIMNPDTDEGWLQLVHQETQKFNVHVPDEIAKMLLWEYTGYPAFWYLDDAPEACRAQVRTVLRQDLFAWQIQYPPPDKPPVGPSVYERLLRREL